MEHASSIHFTQFFSGYPIQKKHLGMRAENPSSLAFEESTRLALLLFVLREDPTFRRRTYMDMRSQHHEQ